MKLSKLFLQCRILCLHLSFSSLKFKICLTLILPIYLKELRNFILCIIHAWSLFCSLRIYISLQFLSIILKKLVFCFSVFCVFCLICFELAVIFIDFYNIFIIIIYIGNKCSVILFSPKVIMKTVLVKTCFQRSYLLAKYENQRNIFHVEHGCLLLAQKYSLFGGHSIITIP